MEKLFEKIDAKVSGPMAKFSEQRHFRAIRDGVISAIPFIIVGSFFLIVAFPPIPTDWALYQWASAHVAEILIPYRLTFYIMSLYICFGVGYNLAKSYKLDPLSGGQLSVCAFLLSLYPTVTENGYAVLLENLSSSGVFPCMILAIFAVETLRFFKTRNITIKMPEQVPTSVANSFASLLPTLFVVLVLTVINVILKIDIEEVVQWVFSPLVVAGDTYAGTMVPIFLVAFLWLFGIHGDSIVGSVARPIWLQYFNENSEAVTSGGTPTHIAPETFFQWFVWIGGSGATIGLTICALLFARSRYLKAISRASAVPCLFNINEPMIFGYPIMLNPIFFIPFIVAPLVMGTVAYVAFSCGWVNLMYVQPPWTLPGPVGAYLATGGDWRAIVLNLVNILISVIIYLPFFKLYDRKQLQLETAEDASEAVAAVESNDANDAKADDKEIDNGDKKEAVEDKKVKSEEKVSTEKEQTADK